MTTSTKATEREARLDFPVKGMHCAACVDKVERALRGVPGVKTAVVNLATERATVRLDDGGPRLDALRRAVAAAGYTGPAEVAATPGGGGPPPAGRGRGGRGPGEKRVRGGVLS